MPTPMPIIVAISGDTEGTSVSPAITVTSPSPMKMPKIAEPIGIPAAITEPKATSSTITAIASPIASLPLTSSTPWTTSRDTSVCRPALRAISIASRAGSASALRREALLEHVGALLRFRAGNREVVGRFASDVGFEAEHGYCDDQPQSDHAPGMVRSRPAQAVENP